MFHDTTQQVRKYEVTAFQRVSLRNIFIHNYVTQPQETRRDH